MESLGWMEFLEHPEQGANPDKMEEMAPKGKQEPVVQSDLKVKEAYQDPEVDLAKMVKMEKQACYFFKDMYSEFRTAVKDYFWQIKKVNT